MVIMIIIGFICTRIILVEATYLDKKLIIASLPVIRFSCSKMQFLYVLKNLQGFWKQFKRFSKWKTLSLLDMSAKKSIVVSSKVKILHMQWSCFNVGILINFVIVIFIFILSSNTLFELIFSAF